MAGVGQVGFLEAVGALAFVVFLGEVAGLDRWRSAIAMAAASTPHSRNGNGRTPTPGCGLALLGPATLLP